jgi:hypothetical protein
MVGSDVGPLGSLHCQAHWSDHMPRRLAAPAFALLTILLVACGGGQAAVPPGDPPTQAAADAGAGTDTQPSADLGGVLDDKAPGTSLDACGIVTAADIGSATGASGISAGELKQNPTTLSPGHSTCTYEGAFGRVLVDLTPEDGENLYDAARGAYKDASDITGIGDGAFNSVDNHRAFVWKGNVTVMFTMFLNDAEQLPVATQLAKQVVGKL